VVVNSLLMLLVPLNDIYLSSLYGKLFESIQSNSFTPKIFHHILFVIALLQIGYCFSDYYFSIQTCNFQQYLKLTFLKDIFHKFKYCREEPNVSDSMSKILRTQHILSDWYTKVFAYLLPIILQIVCTVIFFLQKDTTLGLYMCSVFVIFSIFILFGNRSCKKSTREMDTYLFGIHDIMSDIIENYLSVFKGDTILKEVTSLKEMFVSYRSKNKKVVLCGIKYRIFLTVVIITFVHLFVQRCHTILKEKQLSPATFYSMFLILSNLIGNMIRMINVQRDMTFDLNLIQNSGFSSCSNEHYVNGECHTIVESINNKKPNTIVLEMKDISYKYDSSKKLTLQNLNLQVFDKEILLVTGHIGSGKSTLIKLMTRLIYPSKGQILLHGKCIYNIPSKTYFRKVGFMPQNSMLFKRSIIENIKYNNSNVKDQDIIDVIKTYQLESHFPDGLDVSSATLSGGQRQLIWFLRIFFMKPDIIVMDEPTASLDEETKIVFMRIMKTLLRDKTIIIITHDQFLYPYGTRIVTMKQLQ